MATERDGGELSLVKRSGPVPAFIKRVGPVPVIAVTGGVLVAAAPEAVHLANALHMGMTTSEAGLGLAAGVIAAAMLEGGYDSRSGPSRRTAISLASAGAAGLATGPMLHSLNSGVPWEVGLGVGAGAMVVGFFANAGYAETASGRGDVEAHARHMRVVSQVAGAAAGIGVVASGIIAATHGNPPDLGVIHAVTAGAAGAAAAPFALSRMHGRSVPKPPKALAE